MSRQLDLHWQRIEQHTKTYHSMTDTHNSLLQTESTNLAMTANLVSQLSQIIVNLPTAINTIVQHTVYQHTDAALDATIQFQADFLSSIERNLSASARYAAAHPELMPPRPSNNKRPKSSGRRRAASGAPAGNTQGLRARMRSTLRKVLKMD
ncbi:hypothetical protein ESCO_005419 [Escovopsis weberi]|uniref:Uncharacterized protein n=1 Tax=Escovopsis weberi TaxID=150374 RepID=A0A0M8MW06_ESCWE|nr:hypothetical protein ESCO_005419 [Escovopsis weberi]